MTEKNCKTCASGESECGKRNMCVVCDSVGKGHGDGNWYTKWKPKNTKFPCGNYCYTLHKGTKTCDECIAEFNSPERAEIMAELDERNKMLDERASKLEENEYFSDNVKIFLSGVGCILDRKGIGCEFSKVLGEKGVLWVRFYDVDCSCKVPYRNLETAEEFAAKVAEMYDKLKPEKLEEGTKHDDGKPRIGEMIKDFGLPLLEVCKIWEFGTKKYSKSNWKKVEDGENRYTNAMMRHFLAEDTDVGSLDPETQIEHYAHLAWNALARIKFLKEGK